MQRLLRHEAAVSSVVGTVLMLGITVSVFAGVSLVVLSEVGTEVDTPRADLAIRSSDQAFLLQHKGGESLSLASGKALVNVDGIEYTVPLSDWAGDTADGERWSIGDNLCISCAYAGQSVDGIVVIYRNSVLLADGERGIPAGVPIVDFAITGLTTDPIEPWNAGLTGAVVTIINQGTVGSSVPITVAFTLDGAPLGTTTTGPMAVAESRDVQLDWVAATGTYTLAVTVDSLDAVNEYAEDNNDAATTIVVAAGQVDPGIPYEDVNSDGLYEVGVDIALTLADIDDGVHDSGTNGLVIPPSVGPLSAAGWDIDGAGTHRIFVNLTATSLPFEILSSTSIVVGDVTLASQSATERMRISAQAGDVTMNGATLLAGDRLVVEAAGVGRIYAEDATFDAVDYGQLLGNSGVYADGITGSAGNPLYLYAANGPVEATAAQLTSTGYVYLHAAGGSVQADQINVDAGTYSYNFATGSFSAQNAVLNANTGTAYIRADGQMFLQSSDVIGNSIQIDGGTAGNTVHVQDTCFQDDVAAPKNPNIIPASVNVSGTPACGIIGTSDPGHPFEDVDGDGRYTDGVDGPLDPSDVTDGIHDAGTSGLVIPSSVGQITVDEIDFKGDGSIRIDVPLTATGDHIQIDAGGALELNDDLETVTNNKDIRLDFDTIDASGITMTSRGDIELTGGDADLTGSTLATLTNGQHIEFEVDDLEAPGITMDARGEITIEAAGFVNLAGADIELFTNNHDLDITANLDIFMENMRLDGRGHFRPAGQDLHFEDAVIMLYTNGKHIQANAAGWLFADAGTYMESRGKIELTGASLRIEGATFTGFTNGDDLEFTATTGILDADGITAVGRGHLEFHANGALGLDSATLDAVEFNKDILMTSVTGNIDLESANLSAGRNLAANVGGTVLAGGASFADGNNLLDVTPNGAYSGIPASGGFE